MKWPGGLLGKPGIIPDVVWLLFNSIGRAAIGVTLKPGLGEEWRQTVEDYVKTRGKWRKFEVAYLPVAPPPVFWEYNCGNCFAFEPPISCKWVSEEGPPTGGIIDSQGWCAVWLPREGDPPLSYLQRLPWFLRGAPPRFP